MCSRIEQSLESWEVRDVKHALGKSIVLGWNPENVLSETGRLRELVAVMEDAAPQPRSALESLRGSGAWRGDAQSAAENWARADSQQIQQSAQFTSSLEAALAAGMSRFAAAQHRLADAVAAAEASGCPVSEDWSIPEVASDRPQREFHRSKIGRCLAEMNRCDEEAALSLARALDAFGRGGEAFGFVPIVIGAAFLIDAAVAALIAGGVMSVGAILFALVDEFGVDAWDTIESAVPSSFFEDAGPVDEDGIKDRVVDATVPGRSPPIRQAENEQQLRDLWDALTAEGRAVEDVRYPGQVVELPDGTKVRLREASRSGGPTIDINYPSGDKDKVHIA